MHIVYILQSKKTNKFYIGETNNIEQRLREHKQGKSAFGKRNKDIRLVYYIEVESLAKARKIENYIKRQKSRKFIEKVINNEYIIPR